MKIGQIKKEILARNSKVENQLKMDLSFQVGRMLMNARLIKGMTQEVLAKKIGTKQPAIARIESGSSLPNLSLLDKIAKKAFRAYLIPPRFHFMKEEESFTGAIVEQNLNFVSGLIKDTYVPESRAISSFVSVETNNDYYPQLVIKSV